MPEIKNITVIGAGLMGHGISQIFARDGYPVTEHHSLVIPKRHVATYFELGQSEINASNRLMAELKQRIETEDSSVNGFNIGVNNGESAGQTIFHYESSSLNFSSSFL